MAKEPDLAKLVKRVEALESQFEMLNKAFGQYDKKIDDVADTLKKKLENSINALSQVIERRC